MLNLAEMKFIDNATSPVESDDFDNYKGNLLTLQASGTTTAFKAIVEGKTDINADWSTIALIDLSDLSVAQEIIYYNIFQANIEGITKIRVKLSEIIDGSVTVFGRITN